MVDKYFLVVMFHVLLVAPLLMFVGFNRAATPEWVYNVLFGTGLLVFVYHGYKAVARLLARSPVVWVNLIHVLLVAPLLVWIGFHAKKTERPAYDMLLMLAFAVFGFHMYKLIVITQTFMVKPGEV
jgi:hypothetical protein